MSVRDKAEQTKAKATSLALLDLRGAAELVGVSYATMRRYRTQSDFPEPDAYLGQSPGWLPETLTAWMDARPGRGVGGGRPRKAE